MTVSGLDVIARNDDFESAATRFELRPWQWHLLHAVDGRTELRDLAIICGVELETAIAFAGESEAAGLVRVVSMGLDEYRAWSGAQAAAGAPATAPTHDDHFSAPDTLGSYAATVPAWMIEAPPSAEASDARYAIEAHAEAPLAFETHAEAPSAPSHDEWMPEFHQTDPVDHAPAYDAPAHDAPAHDAPAHDAPAHDVPTHEAEDAATHQAEWMPEFHQADPVAQVPADDAPTHEAEYAATHEAEYAATHHDEWMPEFHQADPVAQVPANDAPAHEAEYAAANHDEWMPEFHQDAAVAEPVTDAAKAVAELVNRGGDASAHKPAAVSISFGESEPESFSTNGHQYDPSWQPMSLVTTVNAEPAAPHDAAYAGIDDGISISLGSSAAAPAHEPAPPAETQPHRAAVAFSLTPDAPPAWHEAPAAPQTEPPASEPYAAHDDTSYAAHDDASFTATDTVAPQAHDSVSPSAYAPQPPAAPAQPAPGPPPSATADIVGSLIARALTFRIK